MAERRMFAKTIVLSDAFLDMPLTARCLYFTLGMLADDDGFVNSPKAIMRQCGASEDDMKMLIAKKFILVFESGVIVIKHWRINNYLRNDRYQKTKYIDEMSELSIETNGAYTLGIPNSGIPSIGKDSIGKDRLDKNSVGVGEAPPPKIKTVPAESMSENSIVDCVMNAWNSIGHVDKIRSIVPCTSRYNELMISVDMYGISDVLAAVNKVRNSQYLKKRGHIQFDNYINRNAIPKLLEGSYDVDFEKEKTKKTNFQDFEQRSYDDDLEERLVNR